jgi:hypothetical protein
VVVLLVLFTATYYLVLTPWRDAQQVEQGQAAGVARSIQDIDYFTGPQAIPNLDRDLSGLGLSELKKLRKIVDSAGQMVDAMHSGDFARMRAAKAEYETLARENPLNTPNIFASFNALAAKLGGIIQFEADLSNATVSGGDFDGYEKLQAKAASIESALGDSVPPDARARLDRVARTKLVSGLLALMKGPPAPTRDYRWFETTWDKFKLGPDETESKAAITRMKRIAFDWQLIEAQENERSTMDLQRRLKEDKAEGVWPDWLRELAETKIVMAQGTDTGAEPLSRTIPPERPRARVPGGTPSTSPLPWMYFLSDDNRFPVELPERGQGLSFFLRTPAKTDEELKPWSGDMARGLGPNGESFKVYSGRLITGRAPPTTPYLVVGKRPDGEAFQIYVGHGRYDKAIFGAVEGGLKREGDNIVVDVSKLPGATLQPLSLRLPPGFSVKGSKITALGMRAQRCNIAPVVQEIKNQIQKQSQAGPPAGQPAVTPPATPPDSATAKSGSSPGKKKAAPETEPAATPEAGKPSEKPKDTSPATAATADANKAEPTAKPAARKPSDKPKTASNAASPAAGAREKEEPKPLTAHPLLNGQLPPGTYTLLVGDGDHKLPLIDFKIP